MTDESDRYSSKPMKKSHDEVRAIITQQIDEYLNSGLAIGKVAQGVHAQDALTKHPQPGCMNKAKK